MESEEKYSTESSTENEPPKKKQKTDEEPPKVEENQEKSEKPLNDKTNKEKTVKEPEKEKLAPRNIPHDRTPKYKGKEGVTITDLQGVINRFRLVGPKRFEIMKTTCVPATVKPKEDANPAVGKAGLQWWKKYFGDREKERENEELIKVFGESKSVDSLTCLTVR